MKNAAKKATKPVVEHGLELDAAILLLAGNPIDLQILQNLVGRPQRFGELRELLQPKNDTDLTRALPRLLDTNLIDQRGDFSKTPPVRTYQLNPFGVSVLFTIARIQNVNQNIELAQSVLDARHRLAANTMAAEKKKPINPGWSDIPKGWEPRKKAPRNHPPTG